MENNQNRGFKRKTITKNINEKINHWIKTIDDEALKEEIKNSYIVTGGAICSMLQGTLPNDYDIYFNNTTTAVKVSQYYISKLTEIKSEFTTIPQVIEENGRVKIIVKSSGVAGIDCDQSDYEYFEMYSDSAEKVNNYLDVFANKENGKYEPVCITTNAITLTDKIQLIIRFCGAPEEIHKNYDFVHCTNWYTHNGGLVLNQKALEAILSKELKYVGSVYPICSMFRLKKFIKRGWSITAGEMLKISYDISKLDLSDIKVLQDQITGVDAAYFREIISILEKECVGKEYDRTYLFDLINRIFDEES